MTTMLAPPQRLTLNDLDLAVSVMGQAFQEDPLWRFLQPNAERRKQELDRFFRAVLAYGLASGRVYGTGEPLAGIAVWDMPGQPAAGIYGTVLASAARLLFSSFPWQAWRARSFFAKAGELRKKYCPTPHYYLEALGVMPAAQGRGYASKLVRPFLERAGAAGLDAYTETATPENVSLYEHYGLKCVEEYMAPATPLTLWVFHRKHR